mgnify:CR=1 FL=1
MINFCSFELDIDSATGMSPFQTSLRGAELCCSSRGQEVAVQIPFKGAEIGYVFHCFCDLPRRKEIPSSINYVRYWGVGQVEKSELEFISGDKSRSYYHAIERNFDETMKTQPISAPLIKESNQRRGRPLFRPLSEDQKFLALFVVILARKRLQCTLFEEAEIPHVLLCSS